MQSKTEKRILWGFILIYIIFFGIFTSLRHYNFQTQTWDMAIFVQTFWNTIHGNILQNNLEEVRGPLNFLAVHMRPFMLLLAPFYALFPSPYALLILQTVALALGAWPLYLFAKKQSNPKWGLIFAAGYLLYPSLHWVNIFDFHEITFLPPLLLAAFYFASEKKWGWASVFFALAASVKEDAILVVLFSGLFLLLQKKDRTELTLNWWTTQRQIALAIILISSFYFLISTQLIMPALGGGLLRLDRYAQFGNTTAEIITNAVSSPNLLLSTLFNWPKLQYLFWLFLPVAFLPFFSGSALIILIPGLAENMLTNFGNQTAGFYQYDAALIAGIFIAAVLGLKNLLQKWPVKTKISLKILIATLIIGYIVRSPVNPIFFPAGLFKLDPQWDAYRQMITMIPPQASVSAHTNLTPHLANREHIYMLGKEPFLTDYVLIDGTDPFGFSSAKEFEDYANNLLTSRQYAVTAFEGRYFVLKKKVMLQ